MVTLRVSTEPDRPVFVYLQGPDGLTQACERAPCDVVLDKGRSVKLVGSIAGGEGSIEVVAERDKHVVIPLRPAGLPPVPPPTPMPPPMPMPVPPPPVAPPPVASSSADASAAGAPADAAAASPPGVVTVHVVNGSREDVVIDTTYGFDGFPHAPFCESECPACDGRRCGSPRRTSARVAPGGSIDAPWTALAYEASQGPGGCGCYTVRELPPGTQSTSVSGRSASGKACSGQVAVRVGPSPQTTRIVVTCP